MADKELSFQEIASHNSKKDLYLVVHDKVYDCSSFVDEHPYVLPPLSPREKGKKKKMMDMDMDMDIGNGNL